MADLTDSVETGDATAFRKDFLVDGRIDPVVYDIVWKWGYPRLLTADPDLPPGPKVGAHKGYVGRLRLLPKPCPLYTKGPRWYFQCDDCGSLRTHLYAIRTGGSFACRECHGLSYESAQRWDTIARTGRFPGLLGRIMDEIVSGGDGAKAIRRSGAGRNRQGSDASRP